jgi:hypothetical protein
MERCVTIYKRDAAHICGEIDYLVLFKSTAWTCLCSAGPACQDKDAPHIDTLSSFQQDRFWVGCGCPVSPGAIHIFV